MSVSAHAHTRSQSFSNWSYEDTHVSFTFFVNARRVTQLAPLYAPDMDISDLLSAHIRDTVDVTQNAIPCRLGALTPAGTGQALRHVRGHFTCQNPVADMPVDIKVGSFFTVSPTHIHIARLDTAGDISETALREGREHFQFGAKVKPQTLTGFIYTGLTHVLSGIDHILFLLALALLVGQIRLAIWVMSGFTLGHTATLAFATLGWIAPNSMAVEALIGFTIALTALEVGILYGLPRRRAFRAFAGLTLCVFAFAASGVSQFNPLFALGLGIILALYSFASGEMRMHHMRRNLPFITLVFGLIHGAGFAGGLREANIIKDDIFLPLLGFNIGVELAQICILGLCYVGLYGLKRTTKISPNHIAIWVERLPVALALIIFGLGCFWYVERLIG